MTHDFAKKPKEKPKKTKKKETHVPGWIWLLTGIFAGIFISFLAFLADITPEPAPKIVKDKTPTSETKDTKRPSTKFDFYTLLPEREIIVPVEKDNEEHPAQAMIYILQAGSFRNLKDADRLRAQLILMGYETHVEEIAAQNGDLWHRVQIGPFQSRSVVANARSKLISNGIEALLLKRKSDN